MPRYTREASLDVKRGDFATLVRKAIDSTAALESKFLKAHLSPIRIPKPEDYDLDVAAYCVLAHGILEYLIEDIALASIIVTANAWRSMPTAPFTKGLLSALLYCDPPHVEVTDRLDLQRTATILESLDKLKLKVSKMALDNNGLSPRDVLPLVGHLGIAFRYTVIQDAASEKLTTFRGARAHGSPVYDATSPADARTIVSEMLGLFRQIAYKAAESLNQPVAGFPTI